MPGAEVLVFLRDEAQLEKLLTSSVDTEMTFFQVSGGFFGLAVALAMMYPVLNARGAARMHCPAPNSASDADRLSQPCPGHLLYPHPSPQTFLCQQNRTP